MASPLNGAVRRAAAGAVLLVVSALAPAGARAATGSFTVGDQAVVQVWAGNRSEITVRGWDRPNVQVDTDDESVQVERHNVNFGTPQNPLSVTIPPAAIKQRDPSGAATNATLPPEDFPYASDFRSGLHDTVRIVTGEGSHVTVMIPPNTAILVTRVRGAGVTSVSDYHGGTLFVSSFGGRTSLGNITSAAFVQMMNGRLNVFDSSFERLRARSNNAVLAFERVRVRQIEVTTISGPIVFDNGTFDPGLARFESTNGAVAVGVATNAQLEARSTDGRVFTLWDRRTPMEQRVPNEAEAIVGSGGPIVYAVSNHGNVYLYDGSLTTRRVLPEEWRRIGLALRGFDAGGPSEPTYAQPASRL